jgi:hypothetical protein
MPRIKLIHDKNFQEKKTTLNFCIEYLKIFVRIKNPVFSVMVHTAVTRELKKRLRKILFLVFYFLYVTLCVTDVFLSLREKESLTKIFFILVSININRETCVSVQFQFVYECDHCVLVLHCALHCYFHYFIFCFFAISTSHFSFN